MHKLAHSKNIQYSFQIAYFKIAHTKIINDIQSELQSTFKSATQASKIIMDMKWMGHFHPFKACIMENGEVQILRLDQMNQNLF